MPLSASQIHERRVRGNADTVPGWGAGIRTRRPTVHTLEEAEKTPQGRMAPSTRGRAFLPSGRTPWGRLPPDRAPQAPGP